MWLNHESSHFVGMTGYSKSCEILHAKTMPTATASTLRTSVRIVAESCAALQRRDLLLQLRVGWVAPLAAAAARPRDPDGRHQAHGGRRQAARGARGAAAEAGAAASAVAAVGVRRIL